MSASIDVNSWPYVILMDFYITYVHGFLIKLYIQVWSKQM